MRSRHPLLLLALITFVSGCCPEDDPAGPPGSECYDPPAAPRNGFFFTGNGYDRATVNLEEDVEGMTFLATDYREGEPSSFTVRTTTKIGGKDVSLMELVIRFIGTKSGNFQWDDLSQDDGFLGATLRIETGPAAGRYRSVSGLTQMAVLDSDPRNLQIAGKFCGTLKDSLGRTIKLEGGRFGTR